MPNEKYRKLIEEMIQSQLSAHPFIKDWDACARMIAAAAFALGRESAAETVETIGPGSEVLADLATAIREGE